MSIKIQLAIQGGGAKIVGLLAAMEIVEDLVRHKKIEVTRIAGTSAGALIGCLYSAGIPMSEMRVSLREGDLKFLLKKYEKPEWTSIAGRLWKREPIWNTTPIREYLRDQFAKRSKKKLKDLDPPIMVVSSNIASSKIHVHNLDESIVDALMSSSGIPFAFKVWNAQKNENEVDEDNDRETPLLVDGGICENLPINLLVKDEDKYGEVVAISFGVSSYARPDNIFGFAKALLDTAIDHSVRTARDQLPQSSIFEIGDELSISTFDFDKAITLAGSKEYDQIKKNAKLFFDGYIERRNDGNKATNYDPWASSNPTVGKILQAAWTICTSLSRSKMQFDSARMEAIIHGEAQPDECRVTTSFRVLDEPIHCIKVSVMNSVGQEYLGRTWWEIVGPDEKQLSPTVVPIKDPKTPSERWVALHFDPPLAPQTGPYELSVWDFVDKVFDKLEANNLDELVFSSGRVSGLVGKLELIVIYPKTTAIKISPQKNLKCQSFRELNPREISKFRRFGATDKHTAAGIVAENVSVPSGGIDVKIED